MENFRIAREHVNKLKKSLAFWAFVIFISVIYLQILIPRFLDFTSSGTLIYTNSILLNVVLLSLIIDYFRLGRNIWLLFCPILFYGTYYGYYFHELSEIQKIKYEAEKNNANGSLQYSPDEYEIISDFYKSSAYKLLETYQLPHFYVLYGSGEYQRFRYSKGKECYEIKFTHKLDGEACIITEDIKPDENKKKIKITANSFNPSYRYKNVPEWQSNLSIHFKKIIFHTDIHYKIDGEENKFKETILYARYLNFLPLTPMACGFHKIFRPRSIHDKRSIERGFYCQLFTIRSRPQRFRINAISDDTRTKNLLSRISEQLNLVKR